MSGSGLRSSLSADDVGSSSKKPGKLSADFISKFESDSAIGGSTGAIPQRLSHASSSGMGSSSASHEHLQSIKPHVKISEPEPTAGVDEGKGEKKRKSMWKWNPLKKMRRFFSRKKSSRKSKSVEDLRTDSYRPKIGSDDNLAKRHGSPVVRTSTMPANTKVPVVRELKERQSSSNDDVRLPESYTSKTSSLPVLTRTTGPTLREYKNTEEAGVSFESNPNSSSLEGLQAAHDKIKSAPKGRRPPSRNRSGSATSNQSVDSPVRSGQKTPHRRSKTDPKDLTRDRLDDSGSQSDILNNTIFEEEDSSKSPPSSAREKSKDDQGKAFDEISARASEALSRTSGSTKRPEQKPNNTEVEKVEVKKMEVKKPEARKPEVTNLQPKKPEVTKPEVKSKPFKKDEETQMNESKASVTDSSSRTSEVKRDSKRLSLDENTKKSFTDSVLSSKSESDMLKVEFTSLLQSDPSEGLWNEREPQNSPTAEEESAKAAPKRKTSVDKSTQITTTPFKRGKSWSNNHIAKMTEFPIKQDKENQQKETSNDSITDQDEENSTSYSEKKDFRFSRTKSWSYGMKAGELTKAAEVLHSSPKPLAGSSENVENKPTWVAKANRVSLRMSQMMDQDDASENKTPTLRKSITKEPEPTKTETDSKPVVETPSKPKATVSKPLNETPTKPKPTVAKPLVETSTKLKPTVAKPLNETPTKPKPTVAKEAKPTESSPKPAPAPKPSSFVRSTAALPRIVGTTPSNSDTKSVSTRNNSSVKKLPTVEAKPSVQQTVRSSFGSVKIDKCVVCGTTVYQMEKCKFDDSVLHRNCIKCTVCNRHLTVGNFVMTESKIYCKPHSQAVVTVST